MLRDDVLTEDRAAEHGLRTLQSLPMNHKHLAGHPEGHQK